MHLLLIVFGVYAVMSVALLVAFCRAAAERAARPTDIIYARQVASPAPRRTGPTHERLDLGNVAAD